MAQQTINPAAYAQAILIAAKERKECNLLEASDRPKKLRETLTGWKRGRCAGMADLVAELYGLGEDEVERDIKRAMMEV